MKIEDVMEIMEINLREADEAVKDSGLSQAARNEEGICPLPRASQCGPPEKRLEVTLLRAPARFIGISCLPFGPPTALHPPAIDISLKNPN